MMALKQTGFLSYGEAPVLSCASFGLPQGGFAALIGPNGAGKSTLLKLLLGASPAAAPCGCWARIRPGFELEKAKRPQDGWPAIQIFPPPWRRSFWPTCPGSACSAFEAGAPGSGCGRPELVGMAGYGRRPIEPCPAGSASGCCWPGL